MKNSLANMQVNGDLARFLLTFIDEQNLSLDSLKEQLARYAPDSRMRFGVWWEYLETLQASDPKRPFGIELGLSMRPEFLGVLGYLIVSCNTLGEALMEFMRYQELLYDGHLGSAHLEGDQVRVRWHSLYGVSTLISDQVLIGSFLQTFRRATNDEGLMLTHIEFSHQPPADSDLNVYRELLCETVAFGQAELSITFPTEYLSRPLSSADAGLYRVMQAQASALLNMLPRTDAFFTSFQDTLIKAMQSGNPNAAYIASKLHVSERTLHRRLQEQQGQSFGSILRETRLRLAKEYLGNSRLTLSEIAILLGYSEQSAFSRAFKQWQGQTPRAFREISTKR